MERDAPAPNQGLGRAGDGAAGVTDTPVTREQQEFLRGILSEVVKEVNKANKARVLSLRSRHGETAHILRSGRR